MRVQVTERRWVEVKKAAKDRISKCNQQGLCVGCMQPLAEGERSMRGLHMRCYYATYRAIKSGKFSESERVQAGKMLEPAECGRKPSNPISLEAG